MKRRSRQLADAAPANIRNRRVSSTRIAGTCEGVLGRNDQPEVLESLLPFG
jgi:hypothetical protein